MNWPLLFLFFAIFSLASAAEWGYLTKTLPSNWGELYPDCDGERQSPINIPSKRAVYDFGLKDITIRRRDISDEDLTWELQRSSYGGKYEKKSIDFN